MNLLIILFLFPFFSLQGSPFTLEGKQLASSEGMLHVEQGVALIFDSNRLTAQKAFFENIEKGRGLKFQHNVVFLAKTGIQIEAPLAFSKKLDANISFLNSSLQPFVHCSISPLFLDIQSSSLSFDYSPDYSLRKIFFSGGVQAEKPGEFFIQAPCAFLHPNDLLIWKQPSDLSKSLLNFTCPPLDLFFSPRKKEICQMFFYGSHFIKAQEICLNLENKFTSLKHVNGRLIHLGSPFLFKGEQGEWNDHKKRLLLKKDVELLSKGGEIRGDQLEAELSSTEEIESISLQGTASFTDMQKGQYACAETIVFYPAQDLAKLSCSKENERVVYFDEENHLTISAPEIEISFMTKPDLRQVKGIGDVRFTLTEKEQNQFEKRFRS